ncbi:MAG TPA: anti-sigma factor antagonist [Opitutae bacterium]|mgnify:CR=1 FL=1|nr:anti-sigma factor antagonist [Opitutae bacterium]|tara:strand:+ start:339 stop:653 length:315 start_codon:yes stop_codon:yes gene_type:complete
METFEFSHSSDSKQLTIRINQPKFDASQVASFKEALNQNWSGNITEVTVDMNPVDFIDSSGIGALLSLQKRLGDTVEPIALLNTRPNVASVIELLRLHRVFSMR